MYEGVVRWKMWLPDRRGILTRGLFPNDIKPPHVVYLA